MGYGEGLKYGQGKYKGVITELQYQTNQVNVTTGRCFRYAVADEQGIGWSVYDGDDWLWPEPNAPSIRIFDDVDNAIDVIFNEATGLLHDISPRIGPTNSGIIDVFKDNTKEDGADGTEIKPLVWPGEVRPPKEEGQVEFLGMHVFSRPEDIDNRGATGFDAKGFRTAMKTNISLFKDSEQTTAFVTTKNIPADADVSVEKKTESLRIDSQIDFEASEFRCTGFRFNYLSKDKGAQPSSRQMQEQGYQDEFALPVLWLSRHIIDLKRNLAVGNVMAGSIAAATVTGPDSKSGSAMRFAASDSLSTTDVSAIAGDFSFLFYVGGLTTYPVDVLASSTGGLRIFIDVSGATRRVTFTDGTTTKTEDLTWDGTGFVGIMIVRTGTSLLIYEEVSTASSLLSTTALASAVSFSGTFTVNQTSTVADLFNLDLLASVISSGAFDYLIKDVRNNNGDSVLPNF